MTDLAAPDRLANSVAKPVRRRPSFVVLGANFIVLGFLALTNLFLATIATTLYVGVAMAVAGALHFGHAFCARHWLTGAAWGLSGAIYAAAGIFLASGPLLGSLAISFVLPLLLVIGGTARIWSGLSMPGNTVSSWIVMTGLLALSAGALILTAWPGIRPLILGTILGFDLLFQGVAFVAYGLMRTPALEDWAPPGRRPARAA